MLKKLMVLLIAFVFFIVTSPNQQTSAQSIFPDTKGHWAEEAIDYLYQKNIVRGLPNGEFGINEKIKRKDAAVMIAQARGLDTTTVSSQNPFNDVKPGSYYYNAVIAAVNAGYLNGYPGGEFEPNGELTREEMSKILVVAYDLKNQGGPVFSDVLVNSWSYNYIQTLISNKITSGISNTKFGPLNHISRSEFAMMLARAEDEQFRNQDVNIVEVTFDSISEEADYVIKNYSPKFYEILKSVAKDKGKTTTQLITEWKQQELFGTINTSVHEITHAYQTKDFNSFKNGVYYNNYNHFVNNQKYVVSHQKEKIYPSSLMGKTIPTSLQTFRWKTYVSPDADELMASIQNGAYGILIEYEAYYIGDQAAYDSYGYLKSLPYNRSKWLNYYTSLDGTAYYEFTYFILNYLKYAKTNKPDVYNYIMADKRFKTAFKNVYTNYKSLVEKSHPARINEMISDLSKMDITAKYKEPYLYINGSGMAPYVDDALLNVKNELKKPEYQNILSQLLK